MIKTTWIDHWPYKLCEGIKWMTLTYCIPSHSQRQKGWDHPQKHLGGVNMWPSSSYLSEQACPGKENGLWEIVRKPTMKMGLLFTKLSLPSSAKSKSQVFHNHFEHVYVWSVYICVCIFTYGWVCMQVCVDTQSWHPVSPSIYLLKKHFLLCLELDHSVSPVSHLASESCLCLPSAGIADGHTAAHLFHGFWGLELLSQCLHNKHYSDCFPPPTHPHNHFEQRYSNENFQTSSFPSEANGLYCVHLPWWFNVFGLVVCLIKLKGTSAHNITL